MKVYLVTYKDVNGEYDSSLFSCKEEWELLDHYESNGNIVSYYYKEVTSHLIAMGFSYKDISK